MQCLHSANVATSTTFPVIQLTDCQSVRCRSSQHRCVQVIAGLDKTYAKYTQLQARDSGLEYHMQMWCSKTLGYSGPMTRRRKWRSQLSESRSAMRIVQEMGSPGPCMIEVWWNRGGSAIYDRQEGNYTGIFEKGPPAADAILLPDRWLIYVLLRLVFPPAQPLMTRRARRWWWTEKMQAKRYDSIITGPARVPRTNHGSPRWT